MNHELFEKYVCNQSCLYENMGGTATLQLVSETKVSIVLY